MDSAIIYLKNRFYKFDNIQEMGLASATMWEDALVYDNSKDFWKSNSQKELDPSLVLHLNEKKWIRLVKKDGLYEQVGPFSDHEIFDMLKKSQISFKDPLWKKGLTKWTPISKIETFKGLLDISKIVNNEIKTADILDSVIEMRRVENKIEMPLEFVEPAIPEQNLELLEEKLVAISEQDLQEKQKLEEAYERQSRSVIIPASKKRTLVMERVLLAAGLTMLFLFFMIKYFL